MAPYFSRGWRIVAYVGAVAVAFSRIYLGAHNPLDVLAGAAAGLFIAAVLNVLLLPHHARVGHRSRSRIQDLLTVRTPYLAPPRIGRTVTLDATFVSISHPREHCAMGDKSPKKNNAKKPAKSIKEKRAAKQEKRHPTGGFGTT